MSSKDYFVLDFEWEKFGYPAHLSGKFNHADFEWNLHDPKNLRQAEIFRTYEFTITDPKIKILDFDFYDPQSPIVSDAFLGVCDALEVGYRAVPLRMLFRSAKSAAQVYHLLLPCDSAALMDRRDSEFREDRVLETGEVMMDRHFPEHPVYSWIKHFAIAPTPLHLFQSIEMRKIVVSDTFKRLAESKNFKGIRYIKIDDDFRYDPWHELTE